MSDDIQYVEQLAKELEDVSHHILTYSNEVKEKTTRDTIATDAVSLRCAAFKLRQLADAHPAVKDTPYLQEALDKVSLERQRQILLWGAGSDNTADEWLRILGEEFGELCQAVNESLFVHARHPERGGIENITKEAVQVAAVAVSIIESAMGGQIREQIEGKTCGDAGTIGFGEQSHLKMSWLSPEGELNTFKEGELYKKAAEIIEHIKNETDAEGWRMVESNISVGMVPPVALLELGWVSVVMSTGAPEPEWDIAWKHTLTLKQIFALRPYFHDSTPVSKDSLIAWQEALEALES